MEEDSQGMEEETPELQEIQDHIALSLFSDGILYYFQENFPAMIY